METLEAIHSRRSIRKYEDQLVPEELVSKILGAAMAAPSAGNEQPWEFIVINQPQILKRIPSFSPYAQMVSHAPLAILVCGNLEREKFPGNWVLDCAVASQNALLAAHALGLGAVWTGVYPEIDRMEGFSRLFELPGNVKPHALLVMGYPAQHLKPQERYREDRIHYNGW